MLDLNDSPIQRAPLDLDALSAALGQCAADWVPALFPRGRHDGENWRLANIKGDAPRKNGSCVITLEGASAGSWCEFDPSHPDGGGPLSTLQHATGLSGAALLQKASELSGYASPWEAQKATELTGGRVSSALGANNRETRGASVYKVADLTAEINHILEHAAEPAPDSRVGVYLRSRGLTIPDCPDLLYHSNLTDYKAPGGPVGRPAMVAVVRNAAGERIGIHRTFLAYDGSGKADMPSPRKMLGTVDGGAVRLCPAATTLGIAEGIETALSVTALFGVPCWAALSARNLSVFQIPSGVERLIIFADAGKPGEEAARALSARTDAEIALPRSGDDFNRDLADNLWKPGESYVVVAAAGMGTGLNGAGSTGGTLSGGVPAAPLLATYESVQNGTETGTEIDHGNVDTAGNHSVGGTGLLPAVEPDSSSRAPDASNGSAAPTGQDGQDTTSVAALASLIATLSRDSAPEYLASVLKTVAAAGLDKQATEDALKSIRQRTGRSTKALKTSVATYRQQAGPDWISAMVCYENAEPKPLLINCVKAIEAAPEWMGVLAYDEFAHTILARRPPPWVKKNGHWDDRPWSDADDLEATLWLQVAGLHVGSAIVHEAVHLAASRCSFHPIRDYLRELHWDSHPRLDNLLTYYFGVEPAPYVSAVGAKFLISAVARVMEPACKVDHMLILESPQQGIGKSTALRVLFSPWFADQISELGGKDAAMDLAGKWCIEFADLHTFRKTDKNQLKAFLTRVSDHFRPPYGRHAIDQPRQCVFAGTCNEDVYFDDPTGARRFWPVRCTAIDLESLTRDKDQLWAEAATRYAAGERLYLPDEELQQAAAVEQEARQIDDALAATIDNILREHMLPTISVAELLGKMAFPQHQWDRGIQIRAGHALRRAGWVRYRQAKREGSKQEWRYKKVDYGAGAI